METEPLCTYFGRCGGCLYQDQTYETELLTKEENLKKLFSERLGLDESIFHPIVASPEPYGYRSRLDLTFRRKKEGFELGFNVEGTNRLISIESCAIARPAINDFLPALKRLASERIPAHYNNANLVVKTGDDGRVLWGGIGRRSLVLPESDYLWTEIEGKRIFYSLDTFFQANLSILPLLMEKLRDLLNLDSETVLLDLYSGVGLFWTVFSEEAQSVWAVEECRQSAQIAEFNRRYHGFSNVTLKEGKTEDVLEKILQELKGKRVAAIVDPPRKGLASSALEKLASAKVLNPLVYISCDPSSLVRDLERFLKSGRQVDAVIPFDFFPKTRHLETLVRLV